MSHPDPLFDSDNTLEDDTVSSHFEDYEYDYHDDFYGDEPEMDDNDFYDDYDDSMDGDHDSAMESAGWGTDEDYGYYGEDF